MMNVGKLFTLSGGHPVSCGLVDSKSTSKTGNGRGVEPKVLVVAGSSVSCAVTAEIKRAVIIMGATRNGSDCKRTNIVVICNMKEKT